MAKRFLLMAGLWLVLTGADPAAWAAGALAAGAATVLSSRLLPPGGPPLPWRGLAVLLLGFLRGSLLGGVDVARRALHPRMPLRPGWVRQPLRTPPGAQRMLLGDLLSLMPGTLAAGDDGRSLLVHCLDCESTGPSSAGAQERQLAEALGMAEGRPDD